jgi:hypothetical protein
MSVTPRHTASRHHMFGQDGCELTEHQGRNQDETYRRTVPQAPGSATSSCSEGLEFHGITGLLQAHDQAIFLLVGGVTLELVAAEILIHRAILEHVVDGGQDRGDDSHDRLLGTAPGFHAIELGLQIAAFLFRCC